MFGYFDSYVRLFLYACLFTYIRIFPFCLFSYFQLFRYFLLFNHFKFLSSLVIFRFSVIFSCSVIFIFQLFGYFQSAAEEHEEAAGVGEEVSIFTVSKRRRVGEAAGEFSFYGPRFAITCIFWRNGYKLLIYSNVKKCFLQEYLRHYCFNITGDKTRRDTVQCLRFVPSLDGYVSASQKGAIVIWNSSVSIPDMVLFLVTYKLFPNWKIAGKNWKMPNLMWIPFIFSFECSPVLTLM